MLVTRVGLTRAQSVMLGRWTLWLTAIRTRATNSRSRAFDQNFKGGIKAAQPNHCSTPLELSPFPLISLLPFFPFSPSFSLNWLWNWSIFLNYLLYLLNKVLMSLFLNLDLVCLSHISLPTPPSHPKIFHLLSCFNWVQNLIPYFCPASGLI